MIVSREYLGRLSHFLQLPDRRGRWVVVGERLQCVKQMLAMCSCRRAVRHKFINAWRRLRRDRLGRPVRRRCASLDEPVRNRALPTGPYREPQHALPRRQRPAAKTIPGSATSTSKPAGSTAASWAKLFAGASTTTTASRASRSSTTATSNSSAWDCGTTSERGASGEARGVGWAMPTDLHFHVLQVLVGGAHPTRVPIFVILGTCASGAFHAKSLLGKRLRTSPPRKAREHDFSFQYSGILERAGSRPRCKTRLFRAAGVPVFPEFWQSERAFGAPSVQNSKHPTGAHFSRLLTADG